MPSNKFFKLLESKRTNYHIAKDKTPEAKFDKASIDYILKERRPQLLAEIKVAKERAIALKQQRIKAQKLLDADSKEAPQQRKRIDAYKKATGIKPPDPRLNTINEYADCVKKR